MAKEIEYKHLAKFIPKGPREKLLQGYILITKKKQVRVRVNLTRHKAYMCIKFMEGNVRDEFEVEMDFNEGLHLYILCKYKVAKERLHLRYGMFTFDFDEYEDGTKIVEVEVGDESKDYLNHLPDFVGENVDGQWKYNNYNFAGFPESEYK